MKHLNKLFLLAVFLIFASCQNETVSESLSLEENETLMEDDILVSDGEEDETLILNDESEIQAKIASYSSKASYKSGSKNTQSECVPDIAGIELNLPDVVSAITTSKPGEGSYFSLDILDTDLAGTNIATWCVDQDLSLEVEGPLNFSVYSSYEELPEGKFEKPENFDLVNWLLNQSIIGTESPSGGTYTFGHIQWAIWNLVDDSSCVVCTYLTNPTGEWGDDPDNIVKGLEIADAARANGEGFIPQCGQKIGIVLIPEGKQAIIITKEVPALEEECSDCKGKVTELELEFDWYYSKRVKIYQKKENSCYGVKIFDKVLQPGETFTINGANSNGTIGQYAYIYINGCYYTKIKTNCAISIGPGYTRGVFNVISGRSSKGGELCEYIKPNYKCNRHWNCRHYNKCRYGSRHH